MLWHKIQGAGGTGATVPEFVGAASASGASSLSFAGITGLQEGDLVICSLSDDEVTFNVSSSGWATMVTNGTFPGPSSNNSIINTNCYKVMGSTPDTDITLSTTIDALVAVAFRNVGTPFSSGFEAVTSSNFFQTTTRTIATDNSVYVINAMIDDDSATISSVPTGFTLGAQAGRSGGSGALMYKLEVPAGTLSGLGGSWSTSDGLLTRGYEIPPA